MSSAPTADEIARDATWLIQALDPPQGIARLIAMDRDSYRAASFLDDRMLQSPVDAQIVPWDLIEAAADVERRSDARWIFHIGHVGSTLVSRLLGELPGVLAIREPRILRDLALTAGNIRRRYVAPVPRLMSRTFDEDERACVKATSFASEVATELLPAEARALFIYASPRNYVASILAGENSVKELHVLAPSRAQRIRDRVPSLSVQGKSDAHLAAAAWACEMTSLEHAADRMERPCIEWADFDGMLCEMPIAIKRVADHFGLAVQPNEVSAVANGPLMRRYSKATEYDYSPALRRELIADTERQHSRDIAEALAMLERAAQDSPLLDRALTRSASEA
jgi:hypothetical protein